MNEAQTLPARRHYHVGRLQLVVVALIIAVVTLGARAVFVHPTSRTTVPAISVQRDLIKPHGPNQMPRRILTEVAQPASGGHT